MIQLKFHLDPITIVQQALGKPLSTPDDDSIYQNEAERSSLKAFLNHAKKLDFAAYTFFAGSADDLFMACAHVGIDLHQLGERIEIFLRKLTDDASFSPVLEACKKAKEKCENEWIKNYERSHHEMQELCGLSFQNPVDVYITHPQQKQGKNCDGKILWTARKSFPNYTTIYLWHEILHSYIEPLSKSELSERVAHSVIQLCVDNELRIRFNGGKYPPFEGHTYCEKTEHALLESWNDYLRNNSKNNSKNNTTTILDFQKQAEELESKREKQ